MQIISNNKGISLVVLIVMMVGIAIIGAAVAATMSSKQKSYPFVVNSYKAFEIANAGAEFAIGYCRNESTANCQNNIKNSNFTASFGGGSFTTSYNSATDTITSTGTYQGVSRQVRVANFTTYASSSVDVSFDNPSDMESFVPMESRSGQAIVVNPATATITLGQGIGESYGTVWYGGSKQNDSVDCVSGKCNFGTGFRAYFVFQFASGSTGDGFTFAIINGANNSVNSVGGDPHMGELMGYGGDSRLYNNSGYINAFRDGNGVGIRPPKFGVEFDIYLNTGCPANPCGAGSRCDPANQHMAYVFWGNDSRISCQDKYTRWIPSFLFPANTVVYGTAGGSTYLYRSTDNLTSGTTEPAWPSGKGNTVTESGVDWKECSWRASTSYSQGEVVAPSSSYINTSANGYFFRESRSGNRTTGWFEPDWRNCVDSGTTCSDNAARWQNAYYYGSPSLLLNYVTNSRAYEDNKHTAGTGGNSGDSSTGAGPTNTTSSDSFYTSPANPTTWLANTGNPSQVNPKYAFRMEVVRDPVARTYRIKSWIKNCTDGTENCDMYTNGTFGNVGIDYTSDSPTLDRTITLDSTYNSQFERFLFGWTVATGAATMQSDIKKFRINFIQSYDIWNNLGFSAYFRKGSTGSCYQIANNSSISSHASIGRVGKNEYIEGYSDALCSTRLNPPSITYSVARSADIDKDFTVNFNGTDR